MEEKVKSVYLRCDDYEETVEFNYIQWDEDDVECEINIVDTYCGGDYMGIKGRFKRAWHAFWAKPICYTGIYVGDPGRAKKFFEECLHLLNNEVPT